MSSSIRAPCRKSFIFLTSLLVILTTVSGGSDETIDVIENFSPGVAPGLKFRVFQNGLNYAAKVAVDVLSGRIQRLHIPDQSGSARAPIGHVTYKVSNMRVTQFIKPSTNVQSSPTTGLTMTSSNAGVSIRGDWYTKYGLIKSSGWFEGCVTAALISVSAILGTSSTGQPTIRSTGCNCRISRVTIKLHGGDSKIFNRFMNQVESALKNKLPPMICSQAQQSINVEATRVLANLKMKVPIGQNLTLDLGMVSAPGYSQAYVDSFHKGEFYYVGDASEAPFQPHQLPTTAPVPRMIAVWISDYVVNTAGYVLHKHGRFHRTITRKDLPPAEQNLLDIDCCSTCKCIGKLLPVGVVERFSNASAELELATAAAPTVSVSASGVLVNISGTTKLRARLANGTLIYMLTLAVQANSVVIPSLNGSVVYAKVQSLTAKINVSDSAVGPVDEKRIGLVVNFIVQREVVPKLNEVGARGFPLPRAKLFRFVNGGLQLQPDALCIYTDVQYVGDAFDELDYDGKPPEQTIMEQSLSELRFQPLK